MIESSTNQPHMIMITEEDLPTQFFIVVEQIPQIEVSHFFKGIYILLSLHYTYLIWSTILDFVICICSLKINFWDLQLLAVKQQPHILVLPQLLDAISPSKGTKLINLLHYYFDYV